MTIAKADILTAVNNRTNRQETQATMDEFLTAVLMDVCVSGAFLKTSTSLSFAGSVNVASFPSDFRAVLAVDGLVEKSFSELLGFRNTLTTEGTPEFWAILNKQLHIWPTPSSSTSVTVYYTQIDSDVDTIALPDEFEECLIEGCCYKQHEDKGMIDEATIHKGLYDEQIIKLKAIYDLGSD